MSEPNGGAVESKPVPVPDPDSAGFWEATARGELMIRRCQHCGWWSHPPLERCRLCAGPTTYARVGGTGALYSFVVVHQPAVPGFRDDLPYVVGLVELDEQEGLRLPARVEGVDPSELVIGQSMRVRIDQRDDIGFGIPVWTVSENKTGSDG